MDLFPLSFQRPARLKRFISMDSKTIQENESSILVMAGAGALKVTEDAPHGLPASVSTLGTFYLDLSAGVDLESERKNINPKCLSGAD